MKVQKPKLSIGMPVYNGDQFIAEAIESILNQTFDDFELIISDNGSEDDTREVCQHFSEKDARIYYERIEENRGGAWNFNHVFGLSRAEYFKWAAHDDVLDSTFVDKCISILDLDPAIVLCYPRTRIIDESGELLWEHWQDCHILHNEVHKRIKHLALNLVLGNPIFGIIRSNALRDTRGIGTFASSDYVFLAELVLQGKFYEFPEFLFSRRFHSGTSRQANMTTQEVLDWFEPNQSPRIRLEYWKVFFQHVVSIFRARLGILTKIRSFCAFVPTWISVWGEQLKSEFIGIFCKKSKRVSQSQ